MEKLKKYPWLIVVFTLLISMEYPLIPNIRHLGLLFPIKNVPNH
jgi:hypothetical protein